MSIKTKSPAHLFRSYRALRGLSQRQVAEKIGEHPYYVSIIEQGRATPSLKIAKRIARLLRAPLEKLFPDLAEQSPPAGGEPKNRKLISNRKGLRHG